VWANPGKSKSDWDFEGMKEANRVGNEPYLHESINGLDSDVDIRMAVNDIESIELRHKTTPRLRLPDSLTKQMGPGLVMKGGAFDGWPGTVQKVGNIANAAKARAAAIGELPENDKKLFDAISEGLRTVLFRRTMDVETDYFRAALNKAMRTRGTQYQNLGWAVTTVEPPSDVQGSNLVQGYDKINDMQFKVHGDLETTAKGSGATFFTDFRVAKAQALEDRVVKPHLAVIKAYESIEGVKC
jgi:hypothetical protein